LARSYYQDPWLVACMTRPTGLSESGRDRTSHFGQERSSTNGRLVEVRMI